jgi:hypothetical protein
MCFHPIGPFGKKNFIFTILLKKGDQYGGVDIGGVPILNRPVRPGTQDIFDDHE